LLEDDCPCGKRADKTNNGGRPSFQDTQSNRPEGKK
jgi:hypothetical protein